MIIKKAILHILDVQAALPVYSQEELDLSEEAILRYIDGHVKKLWEDRGAKPGSFQPDSPFPQLLGLLENTFVEASIQMGTRLYDLMQKHSDIPGGDLLVVLAESEGAPYLILMKLAYRTGYTHYIDSDPAGTRNRIIVHRSIFPTESQKNEEGAWINLLDSSVQIVEKPYPVNGESRHYFSELFLGCSTHLSEKESLKAVHHIAKQMTQKYYGNDFEKSALIKDAIFENIEAEGMVDTNQVARVIFSEHPEIKQEYVERVRKAGVEETVPVTGEAPVKTYSKQKLKLDNGIELNIPMEIYRNKELIEFQTQPDGTISVILKQIHKILNR